MIQEIQALIEAIELRDIYTKGHSERVGIYARRFANFLGLDEKQQLKLYLAGILHDIGKVGIPDSVLLKPGKLDEDEYKLIQYHSTLSADIVAKLSEYSHLAPAIKHHHENYDGSGYPDGLKGEAIPFDARILALCDVFDALTTPRIYRKALSKEEAIAIMKKMANKFDPKLFESFLKFIQEHGVIEQNLDELEQEILNQLRDNIFFRDPLTRTFNREALFALIRKGGDMGYRGCLTLLNIERFKEYNKLYGLEKGDRFLKELARYFIKLFKIDPNLFEPKMEHNYLARIKGDRFALLHIGHKASFLEYKLQQAQEKIQKEHHLKLQYELLAANQDLSKLIKNIGYAL